MTESTFSQMFEIPMLGHEELQISCAVNGQWSRGATLYHDGEQLDPRELRATADADVGCAAASPVDRISQSGALCCPPPFPRGGSFQGSKTKAHLEVFAGPVLVHFFFFVCP